MRLCAILILVAFFVARISCGLTTVTWVGTALDNNFNNPVNWLPQQVPGSNDLALFNPGVTTVSVTSSVTVDTIQFATNNVRFIVTGGATLTFNTDFLTATGLTVQVDQGSSFVSSNYVTFSGVVNFINFGTVTINPIFLTGASINNIQNGNNVVFSGVKNNQFTTGAYSTPAGFSFDTARNQVFQATAGAVTITFQYTETIGGSNWQVVNDVPTVTSFIFQNGVNINGNIQLRSSLVASVRPDVTFAGTTTATIAASWDVNPVIGTGANPVTFNGGSIVFPEKGANFAASALQGTTTITFTNTNNAVNLPVNFNNPISISNPNVVFTGRFAFAGQTVTYTVPYSFGFSLLLGNNLVFQKAFTFAGGFSLLTGGTGMYTFTDQVTNNVGGIDFNANPVTAACNLPAKTFAFSGNQYTLTSGLTIKNGCTVSAATTLTIQGQVTTDGGNSTLPSNVQYNYVGNQFNFAAAGTPPTNTQFGLTLTGNQNVPTLRIWNANAVEVLTTGTFTIGDTSSLISANGGLFTFNGILAIGSGVSISAQTAFASGAQSITTVNKIDWTGNILLRNSILGGTGEVWFKGNIQVTKGATNITNPSFRFKTAKTFTYQFDGVNPNNGAVLTINTNGGTNSRTIEGGITAAAGVNVVFDDQLFFNVSGTITGAAGTPPGCFTFRTGGLTQANINANAGTALTFGTFIFFNHTNTHLQGAGTFSFTGATVWLQGNLNFPAATGDAVGTFTNNAGINLFTDATLGNNILFNAGIVTDDLDNNDLVATKTLTLSSATGQVRNVGTLVTKANIIFGANVLLQSTATVSDAGFTQINGNSVVLGANAVWNNRVIFNGGATTISSQNAATRTFTLGDLATTHGLTLNAGLFVNTPVTLNLRSLVAVNFNNGAGLGGSGIIDVQDVFFNSGAAAAISPQTLNLNNATFVGTGPFTLSPADGRLNARNGIQALAPVTYPGSIYNQIADSTISPLVSFTANPVTIQGGSTLTVSNGQTLTISSNWINTIAVVFNSPLTIATTGSITGAGALTFNNTLTLTQNIALSQPITFGFDPNYVFALQNGGFNLTLTGSPIQAKGIVIPSNGFIVSTSPSNAVQEIVGGGVINSNWVWTNPVMFGTLNITGARTLDFNLYVKAGATACFISGITLTTGTFVADTAGAGTLLIEPFLENNGQNTFGPTLTTRFTRGSTGVFEFRGTVPMYINSTVNCEAQFQFTQNVIFGWTTATLSNDINFKTFCTNWFNTAAVIQIWRNNIVVDNDCKANIFPQLIFGMNNSNPVSVAVTGGGTGSIIFLGNLTIVGRAFTTSAAASMGSIQITTLQNSTLSLLTLTGPLNFSSTTVPWVEPTVTFRNGLSQTVILSGPVKLDTPTFNTGSGFLGPSRLAVTSGFTATSSFTFSVPVQFYVNTQGQFFVVTLQNFGTVVTLGYSPSLFNPVFLNSNFPLNVRVSGNTDQNNRFHLFANTSFSLGNIDITGGVFQLSSAQGTPQTITTRDITVSQTKGTFWVDAVNVNAQTVTFADGSSTSPGSVFQYTIYTTNANNPKLTVSTAYYKGSATVSVSNFNWDGTAVTAIVATRSFQTLNTPFAVTSGTPGFQYRSLRTGQNAEFTRSTNPTIVPFPTQSNGPSPAVAGASVLSINLFIVALTTVFMFFF